MTGPASAAWIFALRSNLQDLALSRGRLLQPSADNGRSDHHDNQGSFRFLEHLANLRRETGEVEGLHDQLDAGIGSALMDDRVLRIARRE